MYPFWGRCGAGAAGADGAVFRDTPANMNLRKTYDALTVSFTANVNRCTL